jgi:hypothetical protein
MAVLFADAHDPAGFRAELPGGVTPDEHGVELVPRRAHPGVVAAVLRHERERQTAPAHGVGPRASQARGGGEVCDGIGDGDNSGRPCQHSPRRSPSLAAMSASWKQSLSAADRAHESLTVGRFVATSGQKQGRQRGELVAIVGEKPVAIDIRSPVTGAGVIPYRGWRRAHTPSGNCRRASCASGRCLSCGYWVGPASAPGSVAGVWCA